MKPPPILTTQILLDRGRSKNAIAQALKDGELVRLRRGAYVDASSWSSLYPSDKHLTQMKALALLGQYIFTHESAALAHGLPVLTIPRKIHLSALGNGKGAIAGTHRHCFDAPPETVQVAGLTVTTAARTVVDCAKTLSLPEALCIADGALFRHLVTPTDLASALVSASGRGVRTCRRVAELMSALAESPGETLTRLGLVQAGIGFTEQYWIYGDHPPYRADFTIDGYMLIIEFDGDIKFRDNSQQAVLAERKRERALQNEGWTVVRLEWKDVRNPGRVAALVRAGMKRAHRRDPG